MTEITLLSQPSCVFCEQAKEILSRLTEDYTFSVHEIRLDTEEGRKLAVQHTVMFAPGILIDGQLFSYGRLSEKKLRLQLTTLSRCPVQHFGTKD